jgi:hypothetical protein
VTHRSAGNLGEVHRLFHAARQRDLRLQRADLEHEIRLVACIDVGIDGRERMARARRGERDDLLRRREKNAVGPHLGRARAKRGARGKVELADVTGELEDAVIEIDFQ